MFPVLIDKLQRRVDLTVDEAATAMPSTALLLINLSGRGDKDVMSVQKALAAAEDRKAHV